MVYLKTVRKWADELEIDIGYKLDENSIVIEMWCHTCKDFCKDWNVLFFDFKSFRICGILVLVYEIHIFLWSKVKMLTVKLLHNSCFIVDIMFSFVLNSVCDWQ